MTSLSGAALLVLVQALPSAQAQQPKDYSVQQVFQINGLIGNLNAFVRAIYFHHATGGGWSGTAIIDRACLNAPPFSQQPRLSLTDHFEDLGEKTYGFRFKCDPLRLVDLPVNWAKQVVVIEMPAIDDIKGFEAALRRFGHDPLVERPNYIFPIEAHRRAAAFYTRQIDRHQASPMDGMQVVQGWSEMHLDHQFSFFGPNAAQSFNLRTATVSRSNGLTRLTVTVLSKL